MKDAIVALLSNLLAPDLFLILTNDPFYFSVSCAIH